MMNQTVLADIRALADASGPNRNEQAANAIEVCLLNGIHDGATILDHLEKAGFDRKHAGIALRSNAGRSPERSRWYRLADGTYHLWN